MTMRSVIGIWAVPLHTIASGRVLPRSKLLKGLESAAAYGAIEAPNMVKAISLDVLFNIADVLELEPYILLKFSPDK